ncbi:MAG: RluA family pseudouridine synthase [Candidatus Hatepunaea meridiana]|nr:RluA family pseudouridine synthase [Candidatus Hatepunaea meridiana]
MIGNTNIPNPETDKPEIDGKPRKVLRKIEIRIPLGKEPERLDIFLARQVGELTRSRAQMMINEGAITINGSTVKTSHKVRPDELIKLEVLSRPPLDLEAEDIPLDIVWEDKWLVVINKPAGMVVHPACGNRSGTLVNALLHHYGELAKTDDPERPGVVHRLDKETSGLLVVCKRDPALSRLADQFRKHTVKREYRAITWWQMPKWEGLIDKPIGRDPRDRRKYTIRSDGKPARTHWELLEKYEYLNYISIRLETGRTHQIRVHTLSEEHPIFGDPDYSGRNRQLGRLTSGQRRKVAGYFEKITRQMLHAKTLGFKHPITRRDVYFESELPEDFAWLLSELRKDGVMRKRLVVE